MKQPIYQLFNCYAFLKLQEFLSYVDQADSATVTAEEITHADLASVHNDTLLMLRYIIHEAPDSQTRAFASQPHLVAYVLT